MTLQSTDPSEKTSTPIAIAISATLDSYPAIALASQTFTIEIMDLCDTTTLSFDPSVADMLAYVNSPAATQTILATDSVSLTNGNLDGVCHCGPRTYSISPSSPSALGLSGDTLTLLSTDPTDVTTSPISITITAELVN